MMQSRPAETDSAPEASQPGGAVMPGQLSMLELIDECANALGIWGAGENITAVKPHRRRRA